MNNRLPGYLIGALLIAGCGGTGTDGNSGAGAGPGPGAPPPEGALLQNPAQLLSTVTAPSLLLQLNLATNQQLLSLSGAPVCDVLIYKI